MASPSAALKIAPLDRQTSAFTPHLMPFHIAYSGPAPISTYFRIKSVAEPTFGRELTSQPTQLLSADVHESTDSQETLIGEPSAAPSTSSSSSSVTALNDSPSAPDVAIGTENAAATTSGGSHFTASFRGREMHGTKVDLPEGYTGIVLRVPEDKKGKGVASGGDPWEDERPKAKGRSTRRSKRAQEVIEVQDQDETMDMSEEHIAAHEEGSVRVLHPVSTFSSFVLWNPDIPVDAGRDEYLRSLREWTKLAAEIHRIED